MGFSIIGRANARHFTLNRAISDLEIVQTDAGAKLISVSGPEGGIASFDIRAGATPVIQGQAFFVAQQVSGAGHDIMVVEEGDTTRLQITGARSDSVLSYQLNDNGNFSGFHIQGGASFGSIASVGARTEGGKVLLANPSQPGFSVFDANGTGRMASEIAIQDTSTTFVASVGDIETVRINGNDIAIVSGQTEFGVTAYRIGDSQVSAGQSVGPSHGLGIMVPTDVEITTIKGQTYAIIASNPANGSIGALSVLRIGADGHLTPVDHVLDTTLSRFGDAQKLASVTVGGHSYVVAGGGDQGVSLFELLENGRLIHLDSIAGTVDEPLDDITALEITVVSGKLQIYAASESTYGITVLSYNLNGRGDTRIGGATSQTVRGTAQDDIILDGQGSDTLYGEGGSDVFVFATDEKSDRILDFNVNEDRLDLSGLSFLYDINSLEIVSTSNGAKITHRGEPIVLVSHNEASLNPNAVRNAIDIDIHRSFHPPSVTRDGTEASEALSGSWGFDTLNGRSGDDTLEGLEGSDRLNGGLGHDLIRAGDGPDTLIGFDGNDSLNGDDGDDSLSGGTGNDRLFGGNGDDTLLGHEDNDRLEGGYGRDRLYGQTGKDTLKGGSDNDRLWGQEGDDDLSGQAGRDTLFGGDGADTLYGANGNDSLRGDTGRDSLYGGNGNDTLLGDRDSDWLSGDAGRDRLSGKHGQDTLLGGNGNDTLEGGIDKDLLKGGNGNDRLSGNAQGDSLFGQNDRDRLSGGGGNDSLDGGAHADTLLGGNGHDRLLGGNGWDQLTGGTGRDTLNGGRGNDRLTGEAGADKFVFRKGNDRDVITDFNPNNDQLVLDSAFRSSGMSKTRFVKEFAERSGNSVEFDFGDGDRLTLSGFRQIDDLPELILFS